MAVKCDCESCRELADAHGFEVFNWYCDVSRKMDCAILPVTTPFDDTVKRQIFELFGIPRHFHDHPRPASDGGVFEEGYDFKFADLKERYQAAELYVRRHNGYWFCRLARYEKWFDGIEEKFDFMVWDAEREAALPNHVEWVLSLGMEHGGVTMERLIELQQQMNGLKKTGDVSSLERGAAPSAAARSGTAMSRWWRSLVGR